MDNRALEAERILASEAFKYAIDRAHERKKEEWTRARSQAEREALWLQYHALDDVTTELRVIVEDAKVNDKLKGDD